MPEPDDQSPPPAPSPGPAPSSDPSSMDLPPNVAAAIACIPLVGGIIFYILEKRNSFVRFYAMQSIIFGIAWFVFNIVSAVIHAVFGAIPAIGGILVFFWAIIAALVHVAFIVLWIIATVKAFTGVRWEIPYVGPMARKQVETGTPT
ncbi:MAG TPA: DUF4870 domain-containing protein [Chthoniobacterales bacterium]|nr:DUF4870 domain-containing protein [Chthoniobacterales bacterium]HXM74163.1 DUF4870 domain-containing protein [Chthoniobacterales bacterium]